MRDGQHAHPVKEKGTLVLGQLHYSSSPTTVNPPRKQKTESLTKKDKSYPLSNLPDRRRAAPSITQENGGRSHINLRVISLPGKLDMPAEAVGSRLVNCLEADWLLRQSCVASYMHFMPARLNHNACLRDVVDVFCAAFADYRRDGTVENPAAMKLYGSR